ncbi:hypothetical protein [Nonlabens xiamenensis]|uniref:hypothetical protein n=1 Tax=Nonlabens xiamenensis TaxID=2341043 RepID=UPI000F610BC4|nr:hypothetical protein [Nonlabens xiamenensis]
MGFDNTHLINKIKKIRERNAQRRSDRAMDIRLGKRQGLEVVNDTIMHSPAQAAAFQAEFAQKVIRRKWVAGLALSLSILLTMIIVAIVIYLFHFL